MRGGDGGGGGKRQGKRMPHRNISLLPILGPRAIAVTGAAIVLKAFEFMIENQVF